MSQELKNQISDFIFNNQKWEDTYIMFCKISKRKDLQRLLKRQGAKSYNIRHVKTAVFKFIKANPDYGDVLLLSSGNGTVQGSKIIVPPDSASGSGSVITKVDVILHSDDSTSGSGNVSLEPQSKLTKKVYKKDDIIVRIKKRLAEISNERSMLQENIQKVGTNNDTKSITIRKVLLDQVKKLGDEYDRLFNAKEDFFKTEVLPTEDIFLNGDEPKQISVVEAIQQRNNVRSRISRAKKKSETLEGEKLNENKVLIKELINEEAKLQKIIDDAS